jgi:hypothetical protein
VQRLHGGNRRHAGVVAIVQKLCHGAAVGPPRVGVPDPRREE